jgi:sodium-dependent dicarboxylate transporter 2/3/5
MADSRYSALRLFIRKKWPLGYNVTLFLGVIALAWLLSYLAKGEGIADQTANALFLLVLAAGLWISEAVPPFAVSILVIGFAIYFLDDSHWNVISDDWEKYLGTWSSPVIWILLGGFFLAMGAQITQFDKKFSRLILSKFGTTPNRLLLGCMLTTGLLSMFMSNTATTSMMIAIVIPIIKKLDQKDPFLKSMLLGVATAATLGGMGTVIGSPPNAIALGIIQNAGVEFDFFSWMMFGMPLAIFLIFLSWFFLTKFYKTEIKSLTLNQEDEPGPYPNRNTFRNRLLVVITFVITIGLWITSSWHNIPVAVVSFIPVVTLTVGGVVYGEDLKLLPWDTLILVAGGLTLGLVITDSNLDEYLVTKIPVFNNVVVLAAVLGFLTSLLSNIMSNTAAASILIPLGASLLPEYVLEISLVIGLSASTALFLPISTPPNAIAFSYGYLRQADFRPVGIMQALVGPAIILLAVIFLL